LKTIFKAAGNITVISAEITKLAGFFGGLDKVVDGLTGALNTVRGLIRGIPDSIATLTDNTFVRNLIGDDGTQAIGTMITGLTNKVDDLINKADEVIQVAAYETQKSVIKTFTQLSDSARQCLFNAAQKGWIDATKWTGNLTGELENMTEKEFRAINRYLAEGKDLYRIPETTSKTCDFRVDGLQIEFKGLNSAQNMLDNCVDYAIEAFKQPPLGKGADKLLIDVNGLNQTSESVINLVTQIKSELSDLGVAAKEIEVWFENGIYKG
jgi:prophage DNA circulation protein